MADINNNSNYQEEKGFSLSFADILENVIYYRFIFFVVAGVIFGLSVMYAFLATPIYTTDVLIQIEDKKNSALGGALQDVAKAFEIQSSPINGEIEIFKSRNVIGRAVESLFLHTDVSVNNRIPLVGGLLYRILPRRSDGLAIPPVDWLKVGWGGEDIVFDTYNIPQKFLTKPLILVVGEKGYWNLFGNDDELLATGHVGAETLSEDGQWQINIKTLKANPGTEFKLIRYSLQSRISQIQARLQVKETTKQSSLMRATFEDKSPAFSQRLLNAVANSYVDQNTERKAEEAEKSLKFLSKKLPELYDKMNRSESALSDYRNQGSTIDVEGEIKALLDESVAIEKERLSAEIKKSEMLQRYQPSHPYVKAINSTLAQLAAESSSLDKQIGELPESQRKYLSFARDAEIDSKLYLDLLETSQQLQVSKAGTVGNVAIIDYAILPESPSRPNKVLTVAIGGFLGLILGVIVSNVFGFVMGNVRDPKKLEESLSLKMLAILPFASEQDHAINNIARDEAFLLAKEKPNSSSVEAVRSLRIALNFALLNKPKQKVVLITSAVPGQGKSFISANLGFVLASSGKKVLLIDADIRRTSISKYFNIGKPLGVSEILQKKIGIEDVLLKNVEQNLDLLPAGRSAKHPSEIFLEDRLHQIFDWAQSQYDLVIIDSPPTLNINDAVVLAKLSDVVLFVVRQDKVSLHEINESVQTFEKVDKKPDGLIFNSFIPSQIRYGLTRYGYYAYKYGRYGRYRRYDSTYGEDEFNSGKEGASIRDQVHHWTSALLKSVRTRLTKLFRKIR